MKACCCPRACHHVHPTKACHPRRRAPFLALSDGIVAPPASPQISCDGRLVFVTYEQGDIAAQLFSNDEGMLVPLRSFPAEEGYQTRGGGASPRFDRFTIVDQAAVGGSWRVRLLDVTFAVLGARTFDGPAPFLLGGRFSPDGRYISVTHGTGTSPQVSLVDVLEADPALAPVARALFAGVSSGSRWFSLEAERTDRHCGCRSPHGGDNNRDKGEGEGEGGGEEEEEEGDKAGHEGGGHTHKELPTGCRSCSGKVSRYYLAVPYGQTPLDPTYPAAGLLVYRFKPKRGSLVLEGAASAPQYALVAAVSPPKRRCEKEANGGGGGHGRGGSAAGHEGETVLIAVGTAYALLPGEPTVYTQTEGDSSLLPRDSDEARVYEFSGSPDWRTCPTGVNPHNALRLVHSERAEGDVLPVAFHPSRPVVVYGVGKPDIAVGALSAFRIRWHAEGCEKCSQVELEIIDRTQFPIPPASFEANFSGNGRWFVVGGSDSEGLKNVLLYRVDSSCKALAGV